MHEQSPANEQAEKSPVKSNSRYKKIIWGIAIFILLFIIGLTIILGTGYGQRTLLKTADRWLDNLHIETIDGSLSQGLSLSGVQYQDAANQVDINDLYLQTRLSCLFSRTVCVDKLKIHGVNAHIQTGNEAPTKTDNNSSGLPLHIIANDIELSDIHVFIDKQTDIHLTQLNTSLDLSNTDFIIAPTKINGLQVNQHITSSLDTNTDKTANKDTPSKKATPIDWEKLQAQLDQPLFVRIPQSPLPFNLQLKQLTIEDSHYQQISDNNPLLITLDKLDIKADLNQKHWTLNSLSLESNLLNLTAQGNWLLEQQYPLNLSLQGELLPFTINDDNVTEHTNISLDVQGALGNQIDIILNTDGMLDVSLNASANLNQSYNPFELAIQVPHLHYPLVLNNNQPAELDLQQLELKMHGNSQQYHVNLSSLLNNQYTPSLNIEGAATGKLTEIVLQPLKIARQEESIELVGKLDWREGLHWDQQIKLDQFNSGNYWKDWRANLNGQINSSGKIADNHWEIKLNDIAITGILNQQKLQLSGAIHSDNNTPLQANNMLLMYGNNTITLDGHLSETSDLNVKIAAPKLDGLIPHLNASLNGKVAIIGNIQLPKIDIDLTSPRLSYQQINVRDFAIKGKVDVDEIIKGGIYADLGSLTYGDISIKQAKLRFDGNETQHRLNLRTQGEPIAGNLNIYGSFDRKTQQWQGTLSQLIFSSPVAQWKNNQNIKINADIKQSTANISEHCWLNQRAQLCFPKTFSVGKQGEIPLQIKAFNLAMLNLFLDENTSFTGQVDGEGIVAWSPNNAFIANLDLRSNALNVKHKLDYRTLDLTLEQLQLNGKLKDNNAQFTASFDLQQAGKVNADIQINGLNQQRTLSGSLNIQKMPLDNLTAQFLNRGEHIRAELDSQLRFAGSLDKPLLNGNFNLNNLAIKLHAMPLDFTQGHIHLRFDGNRSTLDGKMNTLDSELLLSGNARWNTLNDWQAQVKTNAERFKVDIPQLMKLEVTPNVIAEITPNRLLLSGEVNIPKARIAIEALPESAVAVSSDMVIITKENRKTINAPMTNPQGMQIRSNINVNIGDDVLLDAYGLKANLTGALVVRQEKSLGLYGDVNILNGRYHSFGQDLLIRNGRISFSGLASQPLLDIEAIRNPESITSGENITVGIRVKGTAENPNINVFSEPSLANEEALAYLLTGESLDSGNAGSSGAISTAMLGIGLSRSSNVIGNIGQLFGVKNLALDTAGSGDNSQLVVSGNLSSRLQVKYSVGLFQPLAELTLRYRILPRLYLQTVSGINQAVDLFYRFEF